MTRLIEANHHATLDDYENVAHLGSAVRDLRQEAESLLAHFEGRRVWMVNSTARGGGVAELLPPLVALLNELGVETRWLVMETDEPAFFRLTKRIHNLIHGQGDPELSSEDRALYDRVSRDVAASIREHLSAGDVLVVHDPQPLGAGAILRRECDIAAIWRCHIGLDRTTPETHAAWSFLESMAEAYDYSVFTAPEYIPSYAAGRATIIHPAIDPLSAKNRDLSIHEVVEVLARGALIAPCTPSVEEAFDEPARRLQEDGEWKAANQWEEFGLLCRPIVTQVSRWDRLKGFLPLMRGFVELKSRAPGADLSERQQRVLRNARLVLAGPDPGSVQDDPEAQEVLGEIEEVYTSLPHDLRREIAVISLPMGSADQNALMVNALHRCSDVVVQNSIQEGFGLTVTEAMWKHTAVLGSAAAGIRQQIRPKLDGWMVDDPENPCEIADALEALLGDERLRATLGRSAQRRVHGDFLVFTQTRRWLETMAETISTRWKATD